MRAQTVCFFVMITSDKELDEIDDIITQVLRPYFMYVKVEGAMEIGEKPDAP